LPQEDIITLLLQHGAVLIILAFAGKDDKITKRNKIRERVMPKKFISSIKTQTLIMLKNVKYTLKIVPSSKFNVLTSGQPYWRHFYHLIHSIDQWFIDPDNYVEPVFGAKGLNTLDGKPGKILSKKTITKYFKTVEKKIVKYLATLDDASLSRKAKGSGFTKLEYIIGQNRHVMYHVGFIHACIQKETGVWPEYYGLNNYR